MARAYWPGEPDYREDSGAGLVWVLAVLVVAGIALAASLVGGKLRLRVSLADAAFLTLVGLVGLSVRQALDVRPAINLGWEWGAVGFLYVLARNLPKTRGESVVILGAIGAAAVAVAVFGLYQVGVELPQVQRKYLANPAAALRIAGVEPGSPAQALFESRLLGSNEPYSTFALANSLAGFLVGPLVVAIGVAWDALTRRGGKGSRVAGVLTSALPIALVLVCLTLTKSRSAYIGVCAGLVALAWRERGRLRPRTLALLACGLLIVVAGLVTAGVATGRLDRQVLTESGKSFRFRQQYWAGTWAALRANPSAFWRGFGPGNFSAPYALYKLPAASEDIHDPHNFVLETWVTAGLPAVCALFVAIGLVVWNGFVRPGVKNGAAPELRAGPDPSDEPDAPPRSAGWLLVFAGLGWLVAMPPIGGLNPFEGDLFARWLIVGGAWVFAVAAGVMLWSRGVVDSGVVAAGFVATLVSLLAAGGLSVPAVAVSLWVSAALALNLREDRGCGVLRVIDGRAWAFGVAVVWVSLLGTFVGQALPHWKLEAAIADAESAALSRPPQLERAEAILENAAKIDPYSARPWQKLAGLEYEVWIGRGAKPEDKRWQKIPILLYKAVDEPRPTNVWSRHRERALMTSLLLKQLGSSINPREITRYRGNVVEASRTASRLYPTNASLRARLAEASADIGMTPDALAEGREALRLDGLTPHADKKLDPAVRAWLLSKIPAWEKAQSEAEKAGAPPLKPEPPKT